MTGLELAGAIGPQGGAAAARAVCLLTGYLFGNFLTAELVARSVAGRSAREIGTSGNPGMANITAHLGIVPGLVTLAGDLGKCAAAGLICARLAPLLPGGGLAPSLAVLWAGTGCTVGHDWPVLYRLRGGKGVATQCAAIVLSSPASGILSCLVGLAAVLTTGYLSAGGALIPAVFALLSLALGRREAALCGLLLTACALIRHRSQLRLIPSGRAERTDVRGGIVHLFARIAHRAKK